MRPCINLLNYKFFRLLTTAIAVAASIGVESSFAGSEPAKHVAAEACISDLKALPILPPKMNLLGLCAGAKQQPQCLSTKGKPIYHFDYDGKDSSRRILVFGVTHGDEHESGTIALRWMQRLNDIKPRNSWRIVPVLNPDGLAAKQRMNANGVDLNRNFPSKDWAASADKYWADKGKRDPRKFPGPKPASEVETRCAIDQIDEFRPDFIVSVHTPYGVLDFDGPKVSFPDFKHLPWVSLGTFPGSLGRYMWKDQNVPVLTIELKDDKLLREIDQVDLLQDISGTVAIRATHKKSNTQPN